GNNIVGYLFGELNQQGTGNVTGVVFRDGDGDGLQGPSEPGQPGVNVQLLNSVGAVIATALTDAAGNFAFVNLPAGNYTVRLQGDMPPAGFGASTATSEFLSVNPGSSTTAAFGLTTASMTGFVYADTNVNGLKDAGEAGLAGVVV